MEGDLERLRSTYDSPSRELDPGFSIYTFPRHPVVHILNENKGVGTSRPEDEMEKTPSPVTDGWTGGRFRVEWVMFLPVLGDLVTLLDIDEKVEPG